MQPTEPESASFDVALRGYDRRQVDERVRFLTAELAQAEHALRAAHERSSIVEDELAQARSQVSSRPRPEQNETFGFRVEKILRLAEEEAAEVRGQAGTEASTLVARARGESDALRTRVEQELVELRADADRVNAERQQVLDRRQAEIDADREAQRAEAGRIVAEATAEAKRVRDEAATAAEQIRSEANTEAERQVSGARAQAEQVLASASASAEQRERAHTQELARLSGLRDEVFEQLARARTALDGVFGQGSPNSGSPNSGSPNSGSTATVQMAKPGSSTSA